MPPMPMPPMPPMPATTKLSATTAKAESVERQEHAALVPTTSAPQRPSAVGGAAAGANVGQATAADSDLPELKAFGQRWGLW